MAASYATLEAGDAIENVTVVANGEGLASRAAKAIEILGAASVTGSSFTANYGSFKLNDDEWSTKLDRFADSDVIVRNGAVEIGLSDASRGVVENVSVNGNGTISVNATRIAQSEFRMDRSSGDFGPEGSTRAIVLAALKTIDGVSAETSGEKAYIYVMSDSITDFTAHAENANVYTYGTISGADIRADWEIYHYSVARVRNNPGAMNGIVTASHEAWLKSAVQNNVDLFDVRDVSNGGEIRAWYVRDIRSSSFDAYQHASISASGMIENTHVVVRATDYKPLDHDREATVTAAAMRDSSVTAVNKITVNVNDIDRTQLTAEAVVVKADTIDAGLITASNVSINELNAGSGVTVGGDAAS